jgi:hypothetical protein
MQKLLTQYPKKSRWTEFSETLVCYYKLPYGSRFALKRKGAARSAHALVRPDIKIRRKLFRQAEQPNRDDTIRVGKLYKRIAQMLAPHYAYVVIGFGPDGTQVPGHMTIQTWRTMPSKPPLDPAGWRRAEIAMLTKRALTMIADLDEGVEASAQKIPQAVIQALLAQFDQTSVKDALTELRLV